MKRLFVFPLLLMVAACASPPPPPPPAPPPPPPPAPPPTFLIFFDWNSAVVEPGGRNVIKTAADAFRSGAPVTVQVTGFTDTSGSPDYNQRLSERRANAVASELVQDGVPQTNLVVTGRGENDLRVPTPDGVREPQNRRVEIVEGGPPPMSMK
jgi:outer membrane protein OmpA-like peptidoglycan-associated protein